MNSRAFHYLRKYINTGVAYSADLANNPDLNNIHNDKDWNVIVKKTIGLEMARDYALMKQLEFVNINDQFYRKKIDSLSFLSYKNLKG